MNKPAGLNKYSSGVLTLPTANSYIDSTIISNKTLALNTTSTINNSTNIMIITGPDGSVFDVSSKSAFSLGNNTLVAEGFGTLPSTSATIKGAVGGTVNLSFHPINLVFNPATFNGDTNHPSLYVSQGALTFSGNIITVTNAAPKPLGVGAYRL